MNTTTRKKSKEWVGAPVALPLPRTKLRPRSRTKLGEVQATDVKLATECAIGSVRKSARIEAKQKSNSNSQTQINPITHRKMSFSTQPGIHYSLDSNNIFNQLPPPLEDGLSDNLCNVAYCYLRHTTS